MTNLVAFISWILVSLFVVLPVHAATLSLSPSTGTFNRNCNVSLKVELDTEGADTDGADAILIFDTSRFTATSVTNGTIYPDYPGNNIDSTAGKVFISGLASISAPFKGTGTLATVNFTVKTNAPTGASQIKFDFNPQDKAKTDDSNVVQRTTVVDILNSVTDGNYIIGSGSTCTATSASPTPLPQGATGATDSGTLDDLVDASGEGPGTKELTYTIAILGTVLTILGILGLAIL